MNEQTTTDRGPSAVGPIAFVFDTEQMGGSYGHSTINALLAVILQEDEQSEIATRLLDGDVLFYVLGQRIAEVRGKADGRSSTTVIDYDKRLLVSLLVDMCEAVALQWNTLDVDRFRHVIPRRAAFCITLAALPVHLREGIDRKLRAMNGYIGALAVDVGNPVQFEIFCGLLIDAMIVDGRHLLLQADYDGYPMRGPVSDWDSLGFDRVEYIGYVAYEKWAPVRPSRAPLSERGKTTEALQSALGVQSHRERVMHELSHASTAAGTDYTLAATHASGDLEIVVPEQKLVGYCLNEDHPVGGPKAAVFREALGITAGDWRFLAEQLAAGLRTGLPEKVRVEAFGQDAYGIKFHLDIPVVGRNGQHRDVRTSWIVRGTEPTLLTTAYVLKTSQQSGSEGTLPPLVPSALSGDAKWAELHRLGTTAGATAAEESIPTPVEFVTDWPHDAPQVSTIEKQGACGGAFVTVADGARGFSGWLKRSGIGYKGEGRAQRVYADVDSQSVDRAKAYADAYVSVLRANGVYATAQTYLS